MSSAGRAEVLAMLVEIAATSTHGNRFGWPSFIAQWIAEIGLRACARRRRWRPWPTQSPSSRHGGC